MYIRPNKMNMRYSIIELYIVTSNVFLITDHLAVTSSTIYPFSIYVKDLVKSDACFFIQIIICQSDEVCAFLIVSRLKLYPISSLFLHRVLVWGPLKTELEKGSLFGKWWERKGDVGEKGKDEKPVLHYGDTYFRHLRPSWDGSSAKYEEYLPEFSFQRTGD